MDRPGGVFDEDYVHDVAVIRTKNQWLIFIAFLVILFCLPMFIKGYTTYIVNFLMVSIISVVGLQLLTGYCGQISIGHAAFMAVGGFSSAILTTKLNMPFIVALPLSGLIAGAVGLIFGIPALRIKGLYLALSTMAAQFIIIYIILHWTSLTGGISGILTKAPSLFGYEMNSHLKMYYLILGVLVFLVYFAKRLTMTKIGRAWMAIRDNDLAAEAMGINIFFYKLLAFFVGCFYAGIAGSLWVHYMLHAGIDHFTFHDSLWYVAMIIVGGLGSITGAIMGTVFIKLLLIISFRFGTTIGTWFPAILDTIGAALPLMTIGLIIMIMLIFEPRGLYHRWVLFKSYYRLWPYSY